MTPPPIGSETWRDNFAHCQRYGHMWGHEAVEGEVEFRRCAACGETREGWDDDPAWAESEGYYMATDPGADTAVLVKIERPPGGPTRYRIVSST